MLDRVHKISEIVASFAIVASLIFVGLQVNQNTRAIGDQEDNSNWTPWLTVLQMPVVSPDFADILVRGQTGGLEALNAVESTRFHYYFIAHFLVYEQNFRAGKRNPYVNNPATARASIDDFLNLNNDFPAKGSREVWAQSRNYFQPDFVAWVNQVLPKGEE